jgi:NADH-quinone oxidoreductase subunit E
MSEKSACCCCNADGPVMDFSELDPYLAKYQGVEGSLIPLLQKAQEIYGYLSDENMGYISQKIGVKPAEVFGVATFYTQFRFHPVGKHLIMLCQGTACHVNGSKMIEEAISEELNIKEGETTEDGLFTLNNVACLGCCSLSPVMMINGETYGNLTKAEVVKVLKTIRKQEASA